MTAQMISRPSRSTSAYSVAGRAVAGHSVAAHRPAIDIVIERVALGMLAWSERRAEKSLISHERMCLLRANAALRGGSGVAR